MRDQRHSAHNSSQLVHKSNQIAVDEDLLSLVTSEEAEAITPRMCRIYLVLLKTIPDDPDNSLPAVQEWLLRFDGEGEDGSCASAWQQLKVVMVGVDEKDLRRALHWMRKHGIIDVCVEGRSLLITIRNVLQVASCRD